MIPGISGHIIRRKRDDGKYLLDIRNNAVYRSGDFGNTWFLIENTNGWQWFTGAISATGQYQLIVANGAALVRISNDFGQTWTDKALYTNGGAVVIMSPTGRNITIVSPNADSYTHNSTDFGQTWTSTEMGVNYYMSISANQQYRLKKTSTSTWYRSADFGQNWSLVTDLDGFSETAISATGQYMIAFEFNSYDFKVSNDFGQTWTLKTSSYYNSGGRPVMTPDGRIQIKCIADKWVISRDFGQNFSQETVLPNVVGVNAISINSNSERVAISSFNNGIYLSKDYGNSFNLRQGNEIYLAVMNRINEINYETNN